MVITKVLIANRGEISCRAQRACLAVGIPCVTVYTQVDAMSLHVLQAKESVWLGDDPKAYMDAELLLEVCRQTGANAVYPGYGFLSENAEFAERCEQAGIIFVGPTADTMRAFSQKHTARELAQSAGVPVLPGSPLLSSPDEAVTAARQIGLPVLLKATGGGGGIGIHVCRSEDMLLEKFQSAARQGSAAFGDSGVFMEKYIEHARHVEVQIFGDGLGHIVTFAERECSIQRRHQKVVEETPSPYILSHVEVRSALQTAAACLGTAVAYRSAGTVEFILDDITGAFYFLEVNTRLQVEHGITEMVSGVDLVAWQLQLQGAPRPRGASPAVLLPRDISNICVQPSGHAIEVRLCAEDPAHDYRPCLGLLGFVVFPGSTPSIRVDTWVETGSEVSAYYDSLLAKVMVYSPGNRSDAIALLNDALRVTHLRGITTNLELVRGIAADPNFEAGATTTKFLEGFSYDSLFVEVVDPGLFTTVQDYPGRVGKWSVGIPPSGPMDQLSHRLANALVGNHDGAASLEVTLAGPTLRFLVSTVVAVCGAEAPVTVDGKEFPQWTSIAVKSGQLLRVGTIVGGARVYIAVSGGLDVPDYLGSKATFPAAFLGGHQGRPLRVSDMLPIGPCDHVASLVEGTNVPYNWRPVYPERAEQVCWQVGVLLGPQADPDYFTPADMATFFSTKFKVHHNSNRLGIRLEGPRPQFARRDGGEGGSHPSNVHDHAYAIGAINYTGDMAVVLTVDGPSLGGFVCPVTIVTTELWKMGQVCPGDTIIFNRVTIEAAVAARLRTDKVIEDLRSLSLGRDIPPDALSAVSNFGPVTFDELHQPTPAVLLTIPTSDVHPGAVLRLAGDRYVLLEYGPMELDLNLRVRVKQTQEWLAASDVRGLVETCPGVRSLLVEYCHHSLSLGQLVDLIRRAEDEVITADALKIPTRIVHLPLSFNERWTRDAIARYMRSVRAEAPYLPSNIDFIARNNGLDGGTDGPLEAVRRVVLGASYMVLGLGDVYLGAPCAVPVDPRHRLVVPKYNPARTYTPEGAVGIGGSYLQGGMGSNLSCLLAPLDAMSVGRHNIRSCDMCIYSMDSPGGYQLIGRTLPIWNTFGRTGPFRTEKPWLLRNFDQVRYYEVSETELERLRIDFLNGRLELAIEDDVFDMRAYNAMVASVADDVQRFKERRCAAMAEIKQVSRLDDLVETSHDSLSHSMICGDDGVGRANKNVYADRDGTVIRAILTGTVWDLRVQAGQVVDMGQTLLILEAMKMEVAVMATVAGTVADVAVTAGERVEQGAALCLLLP